MLIRPRTLAPIVVVAFVLLGLVGCSNGSPASVKDVSDNPGTEGTEPTTEEPCAAHARLDDGTTYHVVRAVSDDYGLKPTTQVSGYSSDCSGQGDYPITFHAIKDVEASWALCGLVEGRWHLFLADSFQPPADSALARIVLGN